MKRKLIAFSVAILAGCAVTVVMWPRSIRLVGTDKISPVGLTVSIARASDWEDSTSDQNGTAGFGRGIWRLPWNSDKKIIAVYDDRNIYWEGVVDPGFIGSIRLELNEGRPR